MSRSEYRRILNEDLNRYGNVAPGFKDWLINNESWYIYRYVRHMRGVEYYSGKGWLFYPIYIYHFLAYKRLSFKLHMTIYPKTIGGGLRIYHAGGFTHIGPNCKIGKNCTLQPGVVFGNKYEHETQELTTVGDNCFFGLNAKIFGPITIGDNVIVGANAVVTKDIPDNAVVGGVPAKIIRIKC